MMWQWFDRGRLGGRWSSRGHVPSSGCRKNFHYQTASARRAVNPNKTSTAALNLPAPAHNAFTAHSGLRRLPFGGAAVAHGRPRLRPHLCTSRRGCLDQAANCAVRHRRHLRNCPGESIEWLGDGHAADNTLTARPRCPRYAG